MSASKKILELAPLIQSKMILDENIKLSKKNKKKSKGFIGTSVKTMIGTEFIKVESNLIGSLN